jgi:hypothetical protein
MGLGIATAAAISRRLWVSLLVSPVLGFFSTTFAIALVRATAGGSYREGLDHASAVALILGVPTTVLMTLAHRLTVEAKSGPSSFLLYVLLGALSRWAFWNFLIWPKFLFVGWLAGATFGAVQWMGLRAASAIDQRIRMGVPELPVDKGGWKVRRMAVLCAASLSLLILTLGLPFQGDGTGDHFAIRMYYEDSKMYQWIIFPDGKLRAGWGGREVPQVNIAPLKSSWTSAEEIFKHVPVGSFSLGAIRDAHPHLGATPFFTQANAIFIEVAKGGGKKVYVFISNTDLKAPPTALIEAWISIFSIDYRSF